MAKIPEYVKDENTGGVTFPNANAYQQRKKVVAKTKLANKVQKDQKRSINSMKKEIKDLKQQIATSSSLESRIRILEQKNTESAEENN